MKPIFPSTVGYSSSFTPRPTDLPPAYDSMSEYTGLWVIEKENQLATGDTIFGGESLFESVKVLAVRINKTPTPPTDNCPDRV